ncbi:MAG TPA: DUF2231 domain-containing protein [Gemmatimonadales bacterium]|nr:DUF2231 domain-containing protein [Gemmatimonadales bacterium]
MESRVKVLGHALHQMLVVFPLGLLTAAAIFDVIYLISRVPIWTQSAYYMVAAGVIGGLAAAVPGWVDWWAIPRGTRAKRVGLLHGVGNVLVLVLFALSWLLQRPSPGAPPTEAIVLALVGVVLAAGTAWLGGELVDRLGVGIDDGAHLDAPNSLSSPSARGSARATGDRRGYPARAYAGVERRVSGLAR